MDTIVALFVLASLIGIAVTLISLFSEKVRTALGFADAKKARKWLFICIGALFVSFAAAAYFMEKEREESSSSAEPTVEDSAASE